MSRINNTVSVSKDLLGKLSDLDSPDLNNQLESLRNPEPAKDTLTRQKAEMRSFTDELRKHGFGHVGQELLQHFKSIGEVIKKA